MSKVNGYVVYEGPSVLDGAPIVMVMTLSTSNRKTGDMVQTWIIRADVSPIEASHAKLDSSVCGNCPHKWSVGGACYVNLGQAPTSIYKAYKRGVYPTLPLGTLEDRVLVRELLAKRKIRLGAYGDPAAVPVEVLRTLAGAADGHTGYTHQMRHKNFDPEVLQFCMASADTQKQAEKLWAERARTFRIVTDLSQLQPGEIECLSDAKDVPCSECLLCDGKNTENDGVNIAIVVHGSRAGKFLNNTVHKL